MARIAIIAGAALLAAAPALAPAEPAKKPAFMVSGPFIKLTAKGGFVILVKRGNEAGAKFADHRVVFLISKSTFVVPDVNGDGERDASDFGKGDKVKVTKKVLPTNATPSRSDPQKLGGAKIERLASAGQTPPPPPPG